MDLLVKICGLTTPECVRAAIEAGADAIGFVFHAPSPRNLEPARAAELARDLPVSMLRVAVTLNPDQTLIDAVLSSFTPDIWQSDAADLDAIHLTAGIVRWPVWRSGASTRDALPPRLLFEAQRSGVSAKADWHAAARLARRSELILGGGLDAANVAAAIATVRPFGVDVSSGVERAPGIKDPAMIRAFVAAARAAKRRMTA
ncbi:MAG: phosphoribosylanthranilate isomerase [Steroidobacteraceae bacterium]